MMIYTREEQQIILQNDDSGASVQLFQSQCLHKLRYTNITYNFGKFNKDAPHYKSSSLLP